MTSMTPALTDPIDYVDKHFPQTARLFRELAGDGELFALFCRKQMTYGPGNIAMGQDPSTESGQRVALSGITIRMNDKTNRLVNMLFVTHHEPPEETVADTFQDLAVYAVIAMIVRAGQWGK